MAYCKYVKYINEISYCRKLKCICQCSFCLEQYNCSVNKNCSNREFRLIKDAAEVYIDGAVKLTHSLKSLRGNIPKNDFFSSLLYLREKSLLMGFSKYPTEIYNAYHANRFLINNNYPKNIDVKLTKNTEKFIQRLYYRNTFLNKAKRIKNGDLLIFATEEGKDNFFKIKNSPVNYVNEQVNLMNQNAYEENFKSPHEQNLECYSKKMIPVFRWCLINKIPPNLDDPVTFDFFKQKLSKDISKESGSHPINSLAWYNLIKIVLKYINRFTEIKKTVEIYRNNLLKSSLGYQVEKFPIRIEALNRLENNNWFTDFKFPEEKVLWPINFNGKTLWGSSIFLGMLNASRFRDIKSEPKTKGWKFETKIMVDLIDRDYKVLAKDRDSKAGEIDMIVKKGKYVYVLELKDFYLWYNDWYAPSKLFLKREKKLNDSFKIILKKRDWVKENSNLFGINKEKIIPLIITSFKEIIKPSKRYKIISKNDLNSFFGKSKHKTLHETIYEYVKLDENSLNKKNEVPFLNIKICPTHPACVYVEVDEKIINKDILKSYCSYIRTQGGGPCPFYKGFCIWMNFCIIGEDPCLIASNHPIHSPL